MIKRSDKAGGWVMVDTNVYVEAGDKKLGEKYIGVYGEENSKYKLVDEKVLKKQHKSLKQETEVPPWREVISCSGANTEGASKVVNYFLNPINKKVPSYLKDTRHMLCNLRTINQEQAPLPSSTRRGRHCICLESTPGLWDGSREGEVVGAPAQEGS